MLELKISLPSGRFSTISVPGANVVFVFFLLTGELVFHFLSLALEDSCLLKIAVFVSIVCFLFFCNVPLQSETLTAIAPWRSTQALFL